MGYRPMLAFDSNRAVARLTRANLIAVGFVFITWLSGCGGDPAGGGPSDADTNGDQASDNGARGEQASDAVTEGDQAPDGSGCGLALYTDPTCQAWLDAHCCAEQRTCVGNCQAVVACINACPSPRTGTCVSNCVASGDIAALNAIADCSKLAPPPPQGVTCAWP